MMTDAQAVLSNDQDISTTVGTHLSTNSIDLGAATTDNLGNATPHDYGKGHGGELLVQITEVVHATESDATVDFQLITGTGVDGNGQINAGTKVVQTTGAIAEALLVVGYQARLAIPPGIDQRYLAVQYVIAGHTTVTGKVWAGIVGTKQTNPQV